MNDIDRLRRIRARIEDSTGEALSLIDRSIEALRAAESAAAPSGGYSGPEIVTRALCGRTKPESGISDDEHNWSE